MDREPLVAHNTDKTANSPGPGSYNTSSKFAQPTILMKGRPVERTHYDDIPLYKLPSTIGNVPRITLAGRTKMVTSQMSTPGPSYIPPKFGYQARHSSFGPIKYQTGKANLGRTGKSETPGPGPAAYDTSLHDFNGKGRGIVFKGSHDFKYANTDSPGPGAYAPRFKSVLASSPMISFHTRPETKQPASSVGYRQLGSTLGGPKFTMKARRDDPINIV